MGLKEVRDDVLAAVSEFEAGHLVAGGKKVTAAVNGLLDLASELGFQSSPGDEALCAEIKAGLEKCQTFAANPPVQGGEPVGKWGDGVILGKLLEFALKILPLFI